MTHRLGYWVALVCVLAMCGVLIGGFVVQFAWGEFPCPLCLLQRMAMMLCALGPAYLVLRARRGDVSATDFASGYGMSIVAGMLGAGISVRQILLHVTGSDPGYGTPVFGLHLYTWALIVFVTAIVTAGLNLVFARELAPARVTHRWPSRLVVGAFALVIAANLVAAGMLEGLHWKLPDSPDRYQLLVDLGWR